MWRVLALILIIVAVAAYEYFNKPLAPASLGANPILASQAAAQTVSSAALKTESHNQSLNPQVNFGWIALIAKPLYMALRMLFEHGIHNWGWTIILFTAGFNTLMLWPRMLSLRSSLKMMRMQPKLDALKTRHTRLKFDDPKRGAMNAEMMDLYKAEGVNMYGGCLPMLLQMPLLFGFASVLQHAAELRSAHWLWLTDLSAPDPWHVLPVFIIGTMALTQLLTPAPAMDPGQRRMFAVIMPVMMGFSLWRYASGLSLYWATGNIVGLIFQLAVNRSRIGKEMRVLSELRGSRT